MRKKIEEEPKLSQGQLSTLVDLYGEKKDEESVLKKETGRQNLIIKDLLKKEVKLKDGKYTFSGEKYTVTLSIEDSSTMDEEKLVEFIKSKLSKSKIKALGIIKTKEFVDEQALEAAIYSGKIVPEVVTEMDSCKVTFTKEVLRISKNKEE